mmetsp:Transcript_6179/g.14321  ORF Transcript_6179/g.14321 Transcript_6179/m.14321 type:complete len:82 (-) Transcript_6179:1989-2234(-)
MILQQRRCRSNRDFNFYKENLDSENAIHCVGIREKNRFAMETRGWVDIQVLDWSVYTLLMKSSNSLATPLLDSRMAHPSGV